MEVLDILDVLEESISKGVPVPFSGRCMLDKEELLDLLQEIRLNLPTDLKQAKWLKEERKRILDEATQEADDIIKGAQDKIITLINENEITKQAVERASQISHDTERKQREINQQTYLYADGILEHVQSTIAKVMGDIESCAKVVEQNRNQLRSN